MSLEGRQVEELNTLHLLIILEVVGVTCWVVLRQLGLLLGLRVILLFGALVIILILAVFLASFAAFRVVGLLGL